MACRATARASRAAGASLLSTSPLLERGEVAASTRAGAAVHAAWLELEA
jgi:hypothetical protein